MSGLLSTKNASGPYLKLICLTKWDEPKNEPRDEPRDEPSDE